jgi:hypothetical protein
MRSSPTKFGSRTTGAVYRAADKLCELAGGPLNARLIFLIGPTIDVTYDATNLVDPLARMLVASTTACERYEKQELAAPETNPILVARALRLLHWLDASLSNYHPYGLPSLGDDVQALTMDNDVSCAGEALGMHALVHKTLRFWLQWFRHMSVEDIVFGRLQVLETCIPSIRPSLSG